MVLFFYFSIYYKSFIVLKFKAWSAPFIQTISQISLQCDCTKQKENNNNKNNKTLVLDQYNPKYLLHKIGTVP